MNEDETLDALDRRGHAAAAALKEEVAARPVPAFDPEVLRVPIDAPGERPDSGRRGVLLIAAVVLLVLGVAVALVRSGTEEGTPPATVPASDLNRYLLGAPADGLPLAYASDDRRAAGERFGELWLGGRLNVFGPSVEDPRLGMVAVPREGDGWAWSSDGLEPVDVGGRDAWDASEYFGEGMIWVEVDGRPVLVYGGLEPDLARELAAAVVVDGDTATVPDDVLPDGWQALGPVANISEARWTALYQGNPSDDIGRFMVLSVLPGGRLDVTSQLLAGEGTRAVEVRGHPGVVTVQSASEHSGHSVTLRWEERPGEVVEIVAHASEDAFDPSEVLAMAEDLVVVDADEAAELETRLRREAVVAGGGSVVGEGSFADGTTWTLATGPDPVDAVTLWVDGERDPWTDLWSVGEAVSVDPGGEVPATEPDAAGSTFTLDASVGRDDERLVAYGSVTTDAATVDIRRPDGEVLVVAEVFTSDDGGRAGWVVELPAGLEIDDSAGPPIVVVAVAADGTELGRLAF